MLRRCLESIRKTLGPEDEVIVVDSAPKKSSAAPVAKEFDARYLAARAPGAARARNLGWRAASHEVVAFIDDDMWVSPEWVDELRSAFAARPDLGFVTGKILPPPEQAGTEAPVGLFDAADAFEHLPRAPRHEGGSGSFAARKDALERVRGFDEVLGAGVPLKGAEDFDLFDRLIASGAKGRYEPTILAYHEQWRSRSTRLRLDFGYGIGGGARLAKLVRTDRAHARAVAREILWRWGLKDLGTCIRRGYKYGALAALVRLGGMLRGFLQAAMIPVVDGHFAPRRRR